MYKAAIQHPYPKQAESRSRRQQKAAPRCPDICTQLHACSCCVVVTLVRQSARAQLVVAVGASLLPHSFLQAQVATWHPLSPAKLECRLCVGLAGFPCVLAGMGPILELMRQEITPAMASIHSRASSSSSACKVRRLMVFDQATQVTRHKHVWQASMRRQMSG